MARIYTFGALPTTATAQTRLKNSSKWLDLLIPWCQLSNWIKESSPCESRARHKFEVFCRVEATLAEVRGQVVLAVVVPMKKTFHHS